MRKLGGDMEQKEWILHLGYYYQGWAVPTVLLLYVIGHVSQISSYKSYSCIRAITVVVTVRVVTNY